MADIASPCVRICAVDGASGYCIGCGRTLPEIAQWQRFSDGDRARIMALLPGRLADMDCTRLNAPNRQCV